MNGICSFRLCSLSDEELLQKVDELTDNIFETQKVPTRAIPARPNEDYDLLIGELLLRYKELKVKSTRDDAYIKELIEISNE